MITKNLVDDAIAYARSETAKHGLPTQIHFDLSLKKAEEISRSLGADLRLALVGVAMMDIKLGEAFQQKRLPEHVQMGVAAAKDFLAPYGIEQDELDKIVNCIEAHHGTVRHSCIESEIVTNADCYRFLHPVGVISYIGTLSRRNPDLVSVIEGADGKLDEKYALLSLDVCKAELAGFYNSFKEMFKAAKVVDAQLAIRIT